MKNKCARREETRVSRVGKEWVEMGGKKKDGSKDMVQVLLGSERGRKN